jgi:hypothetical protein
VSADPHAELAQASRAAFPSAYDEAFRRFAAQAASCEAIDTEATGPGGARLSTQVAWFGKPDARNVLVLLSGVHGVETACGSGIQIDWLRMDGPSRLQDDEAVLLVHALNPHGFAWDRRVTEEGCDLNRNFVVFERGVPLNSDYPRLAPFLVPAGLDAATLAEAEAQLARLRAELGEVAFQRARKSGQYIDPKGTFFGGFGPTKARLRLERIAAQFELQNRAFVTIIDIHTGLGPFGYGEPQDEHQPGSASSRLCRAFFGESVTSPDLGTSYSVSVHGTVGEWFMRNLADGAHVYLCLEFGTYDQERSRKVLREDQWLFVHATEEIERPIGRAIRARTRAHYFPGTPDWCELVLMRGRQIIAQAFAGMRDRSSGRLP